MSVEHQKLWDDFCVRWGVVDSSVPLFHCDENLVVKIKTVGKSARQVLCRSALMEALVIEQVTYLLEDVQQEHTTYDGLIYMMHYVEDGLVKPLYIGKTETRGRKNPISVNVKGISKNKNKFARWGDNKQYHIGDLSEVVLNGGQNNKYENWANALFECYPTPNPTLNRQTYFWCMAWSSSYTGIWEEFGPTHLTFLEYLMIGVASSAFGGLLLNSEGQNRA